MFCKKIYNFIDVLMHNLNIIKLALFLNNRLRSGENESWYIAYANFNTRAEASPNFTRSCGRCRLNHLA
jgi:hypothetical protein